MQKEDKQIEKHLLQKIKHSINHLASMNVILNMQEIVQSKWMTSMIICFTNLELEIFLGESWSLVSKWWWKEMSTKESKELEEMLRLVSRILNFLHVCRHTLMNKKERKMKILSLLKTLNKATNLVLAFNQLEQDLFLTLVDFKRSL